MKKKEFSTELGDAKLTATFSDLAEQANGSVMMQWGETMVLATAVMSKNKKLGSNFMPLTVDYEERFYACGEILGGQYVRREGKPSEEAILTSRYIDRSIRPLFDPRNRHEVHVVVTTIALDREHEPGVLAIIAASLALSVSDIPWKGPIGAIRIEDNGEKPFNLLVSGKENRIVMIEAEGKEIAEDVVIENFNKAASEIARLEKFQLEIVKEVGKEKQIIEYPEASGAIKGLFADKIEPKMLESIYTGPGKNKTLFKLLLEWLELVKTELPEEETGEAENYFEDRVNDIIHSEILENDRRPDGRRLNEVRSLYAQAGDVSSLLHGTGIFYRGETHVLSILTLGGPKSSLTLEGAEVKGQKFFMHHYNFPPYSSGETGRMGTLNRRSIGHGALAEKALRSILPPREKFPYTVRLVAETLSSNGSTSQASICAGSLALMDGGVPIERHVAGLAMGLIYAESGKHKILSDIQGPEDHHGDMDFKVAGTEVGVCAIQLDVKLDGVPTEMLIEALGEARVARMTILETMNASISAPRADLAPTAPRIITLRVPSDTIGAIIGSGGKTIQGISEETGAELYFEDEGVLTISGKGDSTENAKAKVARIIADMSYNKMNGTRHGGNFGGRDRGGSRFGDNRRQNAYPRNDSQNQRSSGGGDGRPGTGNFTRGDR